MRPERTIGVSSDLTHPPGTVLHVIVGDAAFGAGPIRYRRERLADYLARRPETAEVLWVATANRRAAATANPPPDFDRERGGPSGQVRQFTLSIPHGAARYVESLQPREVSDLLHAAARSSATRRVLWYTVPAHARLLRSFDWDLTVYDCSDHWTARRPGTTLGQRILRTLQARTERRIAESCDLLFATSSFLAQRLEEAFERSAVLVENGVDASAFSDAEAHPFTETLPPRPRLGFVGSLKDNKIDFGLVASLARAAPEWSFVLVGPARGTTPELASLLDLPNVVWLGAREAHAVPAILRRLDLGLLPYREEPYNAGVFPLKLFEYLAAGLPVVGCGLPSTMGHEAEGVYVHTAATPEPLLDACRRALDWTADRERRIQIALSNDWEERFGRMYGEVMMRLAPRP